MTKNQVKKRDDQKQPSRDVLKKNCSENIPYRNINIQKTFEKFKQVFSTLSKFFEF